MARFDKRHEGPWFYLAIGAIIFLIYCGAIAVGTSEDCGEGAPKDWTFLPPGWECQ